MGTRKKQGNRFWLWRWFFVKGIKRIKGCLGYGVEINDTKIENVLQREFQLLNKILIKVLMNLNHQILISL